MTGRRFAPDQQDRLKALQLVPVSRETEQRLDRFVALLLAWQAKTNLVAPSTIPHLWTRHIADSLQLLALAPDARTIVDLGTGGGFPGLVLACALAETPGAVVHLVESNARKAAFLREATRMLAIPVVVHCVRIEEFVARDPPAFDIVTARGLAPLDRLAGLIYPLVKRGARALVMKGRDVEAELTKVSKYWVFEAALSPSRTSPDGCILIIRTLEPRR